MLNSINLTCYWDIVEAIVKSRRRTLQKYHYFEDVWKSLQNNQLIFLQAPTGAGKTEAVLTPFIQDLIDGERRWHSLLYILPMRSLVFNMFHRVCKTLTACRRSFRIPKIIVDYDYGGFTPFKAFLEGDITITTYDTLFYTFYGFRSYGHHFLLAVGKIAGSLVIFDETQLMQDTQWYSLTLLPHHIANLIVFGAKVIVMTATFPRMLIEEVRDALNMKYPYTSVMADPNRDTIVRGKLNVSLRNARLQDCILDVVKDYEKPMLLIFNTVERATEAYRQLTSNGYSNIVLLHSRLVSDVRKSREVLFEKDSLSRDLIVVATQVVEAGIDYDFKTVATEVSPIDSLIQRIGRCARKSDGTALIFTDQEQAEYIYPRIVIEETAKILSEDYLADSVRNVLTASNLVNAVYRKEVVGKLREEVLNEIMKTLSFIKTFSGRIFTSRELIRDQATHLLRLGMEVKCILLPQEIYQEILRCLRSSRNNRVSVGLSLSLDQMINLLNRNAMSLSVKKLHEDLDIPALKHRMNSEEFYLSISIATHRTGSKHQLPHSIIEVNKYSKLSVAIMGYKREGLTDPLIINPSFYIIEKDHGYHLGLVKPYG